MGQFVGDGFLTFFDTELEEKYEIGESTLVYR